MLRPMGAANYLGFMYRLLFHASRSLLKIDCGRVIALVGAAIESDSPRRNCTAGSRHASASDQPTFSRIARPRISKVIRQSSTNSRGKDATSRAGQFGDSSFAS
mmetsp:Transcript_8315/g.21080  ORF Transcript_8315/g.21080 Transcript_8315/m.21080 type:complete len:104 (-) Transcript_8315:1595-1906(-)